MNNTDTDLLEKLAELEHKQWMHWASDIMNSENISFEKQKKWEDYMVPYSELPEEIKEFDRAYARKVLDLIKKKQ